MKNVAICLPGSLRSIEICYKNFIENIIVPNNKEYVITLFYYIPEDANSDKIFSITDIMDLNPEIKIIKDSILVTPNCIYNGRQAKVDKCSNAGLNGWLYQMQGMEECYKMVKQHEEKKQVNFDYVARIRSDVLFLQPVIFNNLINNDITIPSFHKWFGLNDRFAFGKPQFMEIYMNMFSNLYKCCEKQRFVIKNAEWFCKHNLDIRNVKYIENKDILFNRVRMDGSIHIDAKLGAKIDEITGGIIN